jgi:hypothetical protein
MAVIKFVKAAGGLIAFTGMVSYASYDFHQSKLGTKFRLRYIRVEPVPAVTFDNTP